MEKREDTITAADYTRLRALIYDEAGIALGADRRIMLEGRIRRRLKELNIPSYREYCSYLFTTRGQKDELVHLIDVVTTNKTDFFREPRHFDFLTGTLLPQFISGDQARRPFLVWSAGCSTGEEPHTLAIVLSEFARLHPGFTFRILATDISTVVLKSARLGIYTSEVVRPVPKALRLRYFMRSRDQESNRMRVVPELRNLIEFRRLNFMDDDYGLGVKADAIFCRNVIIYFDRPTQQSILSKLTRQLVPHGYLFTGHSETLHELDLPVVQVAPALYRRADAAA